MGACTSRHEVLKNAGEAPLPVPDNEEFEVTKEEEVTEKQEEAPATPDGDEARPQSLGNLFKEKESEEEKSSSENTSEQVKEDDDKPKSSSENTSEQVKQEESINVEKEASEETKTVLPEVIIMSDAKSEDADKKPETSSEKAEEEIPDTATKTIEDQKTTTSDEKKPLFKLWF